MKLIDILFKLIINNTIMINSYKKNIKIFLLFSMFIFLLVSSSFAQDINHANLNAVKFKFLTLLPPLIAIALAFITKNVLLSLLIGAYSGAILLNWHDFNIINTVFNSFLLLTKKIVHSVANSWNAGIILQILTIGGFVALLRNLGGTKAIAVKLGKKIKSSKGAQLVSWFFGIFIFFDDYANCLTVGPIMRPITDKMKVSREKLAFIIDSTAAPIAGMALISTWIGYELSLIKEGYSLIGQNINAYAVFLETIPYRFYNILILIFIFFNVILAKEFGSMLKAEKRARINGKLLDDKARPLVSEKIGNIIDENKIKLNIWNAMVPIGVLIISALTLFYMSGYKAIITGKDQMLINLITQHPFSFTGLQKIFGKSDASVVLFQAASIACLTSIILGISQKIFSLKKAIEIWLQGARSLLITVFILILAWALTGIIKELGTAKYIVSVLSGTIPEFILPGLIFLLAALISFATGTSYGTMGILMPLAIPLAYAISPSREFLVMSIGAVLTGSIFGDHSSPISDTTVLSSMGAACDHIDHVKTQLVYAVFVALISLVFCYLPVSLGLPVYLVLPATIIIMGVIIYFIGKPITGEK